ncbi:hypothetical protein [Nesterenkonia alkaliphila]|uniref:Uncharacterized protein n=1 Tax=Nesterenkonia alkaliphila TaxID=1463631 RepID=A0A7K1UKP9_9MICC|nr:hypothetical protein [Nesterenkonia alkaliphila]MVT27004.1 hypothetical protein [Nesterenkonia alkaliphila]GFZ96685.1 hypothetical protein GCM10011359_27660 [Nesterenkonia alkaliphila]
MPDKPIQTSWLGTRVLPAAHRARRAARKAVRTARSRLRPSIGSLGSTGLDLPTTDLTAPGGPGQVRRCDVVVVSVPAGQQGIPQPWLPVLIAAERHSVPTVLLVTAAEELDQPLAAVVTHLAVTQQPLLPQVQDFAGAERTARLEPGSPPREQTAALLALTGTHTPVEKA